MDNDKMLHIQVHSYESMDKLLTLSKEYTLSVDYLINVAIQRLVNDVEDMRKLRAGTYNL